MFREYCRRLGLLLSGLAVSAVGIVLMLQANIGLEPWSVLQQGMSKTFGITYGTAASIVGAAVIALAFFCGESFGLGTLANIFICPVMIDLLLYLNWIPLFTGLWSGFGRAAGRHGAAGPRHMAVYEKRPWLRPAGRTDGGAGPQNPPVGGRLPRRR